MDESEHIDRNALRSVRDLMSGKFPGLVERYLQNTAVYIEKARRAAAERNADELASMMHMIKSSSASFGLTRMTQISKKIEMAADAMKNDNADGWVGITGSLEALEDSFRIAQEILARETNVR